MHISLICVTHLHLEQPHVSKARNAFSESECGTAHGPHDLPTLMPSRFTPVIYPPESLPAAFDVPARLPWLSRVSV